MAASLWAHATTAATPGLRLLLRRRAKRGKEITERLHERRGIEANPRPAGPLLWMHAASVGESISVLPVIRAIAERRNDVSILVTSGTVTSATLLVRRLAEFGLQHRVMHRFAPLDVPRWVGRFLDHWRPDAGAFVESELWPNLLAGCKSRGIPMLLVNARMSGRSYRKWRYAKTFARDLVGSFQKIYAQSELDAERLRELGARVVRVAGNLKFAAPPLPADPIELARVRQWLGDTKCWLAASTHPREEDVVFEAHRILSQDDSGLVTIIAPRHPERGSEIVSTSGIPARRRALGEGPPPSGVWVVDTLGELGLWYRVTGIALIGRSLVPPGGGQNPLEAARLGCAVAVGPYTGNFVEAVQALDEAGVITRVADGPSIAAWARRFLNAPELRAAAGKAAASMAERHADLPGRIADELLEWIARPSRK